MLDMYGCKYYPLHDGPKEWHDSQYLDDPFRVDIGNGILNNPVVITPGRIQERLSPGNKLILGVGVNQNTGVLNAGDTAHWVVVEKVQPAGVDNGQVLLYNPLPNAQQVVPYDQLIQASKAFVQVNGGDPAGQPPMGVFVDPSTCSPYTP